MGHSSSGPIPYSQTSALLGRKPQAVQLSSRPQAPDTLEDTAAADLGGGSWQMAKASQGPCYRGAGRTPLPNCLSSFPRGPCPPIQRVMLQPQANTGMKPRPVTPAEERGEAEQTWDCSLAGPEDPVGCGGRGEGGITDLGGGGVAASPRLWRKGGQGWKSLPGRAAQDLGLRGSLGPAWTTPESLMRPERGRASRLQTQSSPWGPP